MRFYQIALVFSCYVLSYAENNLVNQLLHYSYFTEEHKEALNSFKSLDSALKSEVLESLSIALKSSSWEIRYNATWAFVKLGREAESASESLILALKDENAMVRGNSAWALGIMGKLDQEIIELLSRSLSDSDWYVRYSSAKALGLLGLEQEKTPSILIEAVQDKDYRIRIEAIEALGKLNIATKESIEGLIKVLSDENFLVRATSSRILAELGGNAEEKMVEMLASKNNESEQNYLAIALLNSEKQQKMALEVLYHSLKKGLGKERFELVRAMGENPNSIPLLMKILTEDELKTPDLRGYVREKLYKVAAKGRSYLIEEFKTGGSKSKLVILRLWVVTRSGTPEIIELLEKAVKNEKEEKVREKVAKVLDFFEKGNEDYFSNEEEKWFR